MTDEQFLAELKGLTSVSVAGYFSNNDGTVNRVKTLDLLYKDKFTPEERATLLEEEK